MIKQVFVLKAFTYFLTFWINIRFWMKKASKNELKIHAKIIKRWHWAGKGRPDVDFDYFLSGFGKNEKKQIFWIGQKSTKNQTVCKNCKIGRRGGRVDLGPGARNPPHYPPQGSSRSSNRQRLELKLSARFPASGLRLKMKNKKISFERSRINEMKEQKVNMINKDYLKCISKNIRIYLNGSTINQ